VAVDHFTLPAMMALGPVPVPGEKHFLTGFGKNQEWLVEKGL